MTWVSSQSTQASLGSSQYTGKQRKGAGAKGGGAGGFNPYLNWLGVQGKGCDSAGAISATLCCILSEPIPLPAAQQGAGGFHCDCYQEPTAVLLDKVSAVYDQHVRCQVMDMCRPSHPCFSSSMHSSRPTGPIDPVLDSHVQCSRQWAHKGTAVGM